MDTSADKEMGVDRSVFWSYGSVCDDEFFYQLCGYYQNGKLWRGRSKIAGSAVRNVPKVRYFRVFVGCNEIARLDESGSLVSNLHYAVLVARHCCNYI